MLPLVMVFLVAIIALIVCSVAVMYAHDADRFADKCHQRMNGIMEKFARVDYGQNDVKRLMYEVFGEGRSHVYPDMGLREWARVWRQRLREDVSNLKNNVAYNLEVKALDARVGDLEASRAIPDVSQADIKSLDERIDTVSELRHLDSQDLREGQRAHNELALAFLDLCDKLGYEADETNRALRKKPRARK